MSRRRRKKHKKRPDVYGRPFRLSVTGVELARGHDGFLRGSPEPAIVLALFSGGGASPLLLARSVIDVPMQTVHSFPASVVLDDRRVMSTDLRNEGPLLLLGFAVEVDSGELLQHLYARVEQPDRWTAWRVTDHTPTPMSLTEHARSEPTSPPSARRLHLLWDEHNLDAIGRELGDDYVDASSIVLRSPVGGKQSYRMHFSSQDEKNDWTVELTIGNRW